MGVTVETPVLAPQMLLCLEGGSKYLPEPISRIAHRLCGCGCPEAAYDWIAERLSSQDWRYPEASEGAEWIARYFIDDLGLTEHGSNIVFAWPTDAGLVALGFLCRWGSDWIDKGPWVDATGCSWGME